MSSRRMRMLTSLVLAALVLIALSSFTDASSRIHGFSPQDVYGSFSNNVPLRSDQVEIQPAPSIIYPSISSGLPSPTNVLDSDSGQSKKTGNEPQLPNGAPTWFEYAVG
jgi:hypothetical protein